MLVSELIEALQVVLATKGDLPVALRSSKDDYPFDGPGIFYESCKAEYLGVASVEFEDITSIPNTGHFGCTWVKTKRSGPHLVIDAS